MGEAWATSGALWVVDVNTGKPRFLATALSVEVMPKGRWAGHLLVHKSILPLIGGRLDRIFLLDPDGHEVGLIGDTEANEKQFKQEN